LLFFEKSTFSQKKDTLYLLNGTDIIGEVKGIQMGVLTFDPDDANDITVQLRKINTIRAHTKIFRIETIDNKVYYAKLQPSDQKGFVKIITGTDTSHIWLRDINRLSTFESGIWKQFSGNIAVGFSYTRSSNLGRLNFDGALKFVSKSYEFNLTANQISTITDTTFSRDRENITLKGSYYFNATWFSSAYLNYQRNIELGIARRYQEGIGIGKKFLTKTRMQAKAVAGLVLNQEKSTEGYSSKTLVEIPFQLEYDLYKFSKPKIDLTFTQSVYFSLSQKGRVRNDGQLTVNWEMIEDLTLGLTFYNNYDNQSPVAGSRNFDYGIVFNIGYKF
jgi:hypothetical protein